MLVLTVLADNVFFVQTVFLDDDPAFFRSILHLQADATSGGHAPAAGVLDAITQLANFTTWGVVTDTFAILDCGNREDSLVPEQVKQLFRV